MLAWNCERVERRQRSWWASFVMAVDRGLSALWRSWMILLVRWCTVFAWQMIVRDVTGLDES